VEIMFSAWQKGDNQGKECSNKKAEAIDETASAKKTRLR